MCILILLFIRRQSKAVYLKSNNCCYPQDFLFKDHVTIFLAAPPFNSNEASAPVPPFLHITPCTHCTGGFAGFKLNSSQNHRMAWLVRDHKEYPVPLHRLSGQWQEQLQQHKWGGAATHAGGGNGESQKTLEPAMLTEKLTQAVEEQSKLFWERGGGERQNLHPQSDAGYARKTMEKKI